RRASPLACTYRKNMPRRTTSSCARRKNRCNQHSSASMRSSCLACRPVGSRSFLLSNHINGELGWRLAFVGGVNATGKGAGGDSLGRAVHEVAIAGEGVGPFAGEQCGNFVGGFCQWFGINGDAQAFIEGGEQACVASGTGRLGGGR